MNDKNFSAGNLIALKFRPSSHSTHFTYLAEFQNSVSARVAKKQVLKSVRKLMRNSSDVGVELNEQVLMVSGFTASPGRTEKRKVGRFLRRLGGVARIRLGRSVSGYLKVRITLPAKATPQVALVLLPKDQAQALSQLMRNLPYETEQSEKVTTIEFAHNWGRDPFCFVQKSLFSQYCLVHHGLQEETNINLRWENWKVSTMPELPSPTLKLRTVFRAEQRGKKIGKDLFSKVTSK